MIASLGKFTDTVKNMSYKCDSADTFKRPVVFYVSARHISKQQLRRYFSWWTNCKVNRNNDCWMPFEQHSLMAFDWTCLVAPGQ